ncbi:DUF3280 domain-containing protein [Methylocystis sp. IM2]|uniref:DUF3280 domain-containing protein n=1 Tax=unclassified Methylocystis TaxID=2625913 RepID=UPI0030FBF4C2
MGSLKNLLRACAIVALLALTPAAATESSRPIKLAVFDLELDDFSTGGPIAGESAAETARLQRMTTLVRDLLSRSGLFELVDVNASASPTVADHWLRKCNGCDADAARDLGADMSFVGFFRKISVMEQYLELRIRDARTGGLSMFRRPICVARRTSPGAEP